MLTFKQCCENVVRECKDGYAVTYALRGLDLVNLDAGDSAIRTQALYLIGNLTRWRGAAAKLTRTSLQHIIKQRCYT